ACVTPIPTATNATGSSRSIWSTGPGRSADSTSACSRFSVPVMFQWGMYGTAPDVARGVSRLLVQQGFSPILEFTLANGRRLDVAALGADGTMLGVEIKVSVADLRGDQKWPEYLEFCELFYFAIPPDFPDHHVPDGTGLIVADRFGGAIVRPSQR